MASKDLYFVSSFLAAAAAESVARAIAGSRLTDCAAAILLSVQALESYMHDLYGDLADDPEDDLPADLRRLKLVAQLFERDENTFGRRLALLHIFWKGKPLPKGRRPYQDFHLLHRLRNELVHFKPELVEFDSRGVTMRKGIHGELLKEFKRRGLVPDDEPLRTAWFQHLCTPTIVKWACQVIAEMVRFIVDLTPEGTYMRRTAEHLGRDIEALAS